MNAPMTHADLVERIREMLLDAGTTGIQQKYITLRMVNMMKAADIVHQLEQWLKVGAVQKFFISDKPHRPITIWRATTKLAEIEGDEYKY